MQPMSFRAPPVQFRPSLFKRTAPRRFPLSRKHHPIRPQQSSPREYTATLKTRPLIQGPTQINLRPIGLNQTIQYSLDTIRQWLIEQYQAENIRLEARPADHLREAYIDCSWTAKPRIGKKNRAFLASHGINV